MNCTLSVPSYIIPGTYVENLDFLYNNTDCRSVELLFFIYDEDTKTLLQKESAKIKAYSQFFSFTVHMPDEVLPEHEEIILATKDYARHYIIHPPGNKETLPSFVKLFKHWQNSYGNDRLLLENTRLDNFETALKAIEASQPGPVFLCVDLGHLLMEGLDPVPWIGKRAKSIKELHVHGFDGQKDHVLFSAEDAWIEGLKPFLDKFGGLIEVELFSWPEQEIARSILTKAWEL